MRPSDAVAPILRATALSQKIMLRFYSRTRAKRDVDERRAQFYRRVWHEAAEAVGCTLWPLDHDVFEIRGGQLTVRVRDNLTSLDDPVTIAVAGDKPLVHRLLAARGIPVPRHTVCPCGDLRTAWRFVAGAAGACVVKPARASAGGTGVTTGVRDQYRLARAMARAGAYCDDVVVEEQVDGDVYRLLYLDGELIDAVVRRPPRVLGDGRATVGQLIRSENAARRAGGIDASQSLVKIDRELRDRLHDAGYTLRSVPQRGESVLLKNVVNDNRREDNEPAADRLCEEVIASGCAAAAALGVRLAGVDVITIDPSVGLPESGGVVVEINTAPGYYYHYLNQGPGVPVAALILQRLIAAGR